MNVTGHMDDVRSLPRGEYKVARASQNSAALAGHPHHPDFKVPGQQWRDGLKYALDAMASQ
jgi:hypothetical protein